MNLALRLLGQAPERRAWVTNPSLAQLLGPYARSAYGSQASTVAASWDGAKTHAAVYACVDLLCRLICTMPVDVHRDGQGGRVEVEAPSLIASPSPEPWMPAEGWRRQVLESWLLRGYAAGLVVSERSGWPEQIQVVHPDQVTWRRTSALGVEWRLDGRAVGSWWDGTGPLWVAPSIHATPGSPVGASVLRYAASTIGLGLGAHRFGADWFDNSSHPSGIVSVDVPELNEPQAKEIKARWRESVAAREPVVLSRVADYKPLQIQAEESQFLETIQANKTDIAGYFGVPPGKIGAKTGDSLTYATVEGNNLELLTDTVGAWITWFESSLRLLLPPGHFVKFVPDALLKTSTITRYQAHERALRSGWKSQNEVRSDEDMPPVDGGDELLWPPYSMGTVAVTPAPGEGLTSSDDQTQPSEAEQ